ncbi:SDR family oxidoreductase [Fructilactobacillus cliffordii]|uniref:NAD(P)H-binding protein n=1 Tax=Fructilactobacillus cliffordii TaxID=2940299 RepID=UPI0020929637|nr:NAD(P)H-binding protein [Fructilactobacillus cliffordii]USS85982.1 SDR family oxidoreductase [Fructilactobacillus cliffordii]
MTDSILVVGNGPLTTDVKHQLDATNHVIIKQEQLTEADTYAQLPPQLAAVVVTAGPNDVDLVVEAVDAVLQRQRVMVQRWILVSAAGIDGEVQGSLKYPGVTNVAEYLREQRYAIKLIDETELPYLIIRPGRLVAEKQSPAQLFNEGESVPAGVVSYETISNLIKAGLQGKYQNQSIAVIETAEEEE